MNKRRRKFGSLTRDDLEIWQRVTTNVAGYNKESVNVKIDDDPAQSMFNRALSQDTRIVTQNESVGYGGKQAAALGARGSKSAKRKNPKLQIEHTVDLHGCDQNLAYSLLLRRFAYAQKSGWRTVLVITGKGGMNGDGVLRRLVPLWLDTSLFRSFVAGYQMASQRDGGGGALYVTIRR